MRDRFLAIYLIVVGLLGVYLGVYQCLFLGIVQTIDGIIASPVDSVYIALGIIRFLCTGVVLILTYLLGFVLPLSIKFFNN